MVIALTAVTMFFLAGGRTAPPRRDRRSPALVALVAVGLQAYQLDRIRTWLDPWSDTLGARLPHDPGPARTRARRHPRRRPRREPAGRRAVPAERQQRLHLRDHRRGVRADRRRRRDRPVRRSRLRWHPRRRSRAPDTFGALLAAGITAWLCIQAFINIGVVVALLPVTGITLPFISAGGSSLTISLAAVGILLSISRETVERGTWNDAAADRGRRDGRAHLPGSRRRPRRSASDPSPTRLISSGSAAIAGSRPTSSATPGIRVRRLALRSLRTVDRSVHMVLDPVRLALSVPQAAAILAARAAGRDLHDRRLRRRSRSLIAAAPLRIPVVLWEGNVIPGRASGRPPGSPTRSRSRTTRPAGALAGAGVPRYVTGTPIRDVAAIDRGRGAGAPRTCRPTRRRS